MNRPLTKAGRYQIVSELGRGAMGVVYEGFDPVIGRSVAIKTMLTEGLSGSEFETYRARFQREAQAAGALAHPNIVTIYDFGEDDGFLFLAMELLRGKSLEKLLHEQTVLPIETIIPIYQQVCSALDFAHLHKIVHRDIKPANIMILDSGLVKVADFGIAKMMSTGMTRAGQILGTPNYMSPEQVKGRQVDGRSDIFALGVILYELVTGEKPFSGQNVTTVIYKIMHENPIPPRELEPTIHPGLSYVITRALAKGMDERYQSCSELAEDLKNYRNLGAQSATNSTAVIQRPMLELAPNETAALDVGMMRGPARAQPSPPLQPPPVYPPQAAQAPSVPRVQAPAAPQPPVGAQRPPAPQARPAPVQATPQMHAAPQIQPAPIEPPAVQPPRVLRTPVAQPSPQVRVPPSIQSAPVQAPRTPAPPPAQPAPKAAALSKPQGAGGPQAPPAKPAPAAVAAASEPVAVQPPPVEKRISQLVWVGVATLLAIAAAGGYFTRHRGKVVPGNPSTTGTGPVAVKTDAATPGAPAGGSPVIESPTVKSNDRPSQIAPVSPPQAGRPSERAQAPPSVSRPKPLAESAATAVETQTVVNSKPKPVAAAAGTGELSITANVDGAKISIDGKGEADWVAPRTLSLPAGTHQVAVLKDGYVTWGKSVTVEAGAAESVAAQLLPPTGEINIITEPPGLEVFVDGKSIGPSPARAIVSVGEHKYKIIAPSGQPPFESTITAKETSIAKKTLRF